MRTWIWATALGAAAIVLAGSVWAWDQHLDFAQTQRFGKSPGLAVAHEGGFGNQSFCHVIQGVAPAAHHDLLGRMWQDEHLLWEDVVIRQSAGEFQHGRAGPVQVGDKVCGLAFGESTFYTYRPTGEALWTEIA